MTETPTGPTEPSAAEPAPESKTGPPPAERRHTVHQVAFVAYPKLLFIWPVILLGLVFYPLGYRGQSPASAPASPTVAPVPAHDAAPDDATAAPRAPAAAARSTPAATSGRLEVLGWVYIWTIVLVLLTLGVDVDRNKAVFFIVLAGGLYILGLWLRDARGFTLFGDIYRWFADLDVQYERRLGLVLSILLLVPYVLMFAWAWLNDRWRITHNEFEHYSWGKMNDSLGRGAKTIRTDFPDVFESLLGLAGTLIVYNATGTKELRRIPHIMFLPFVRRRLDKILERTAITAAEMEEEEDDDA